MVKHPCGICQKAVANNHKAICCDICNKWIHISCNNVDRKTYIKLHGSNTTWYCTSCMKKELHFNTTTNQEFAKIYSGKYIIPFTQQKIQNFKENVIELLKEQSNNIISCSYYDITEISQINDVDKKKSFFSLLHMNISSLSYHFEELEELLNEINIKFSIIGISESKLRANLNPLSNTTLKNYNIEHTTTKSKKGGTLLYISSKLNCKVHSDLIMCKTKELESIFIEIINKKGKNQIIGCIYKHPKMLISKFCEDFLKDLTEKLSKENKEIYLMGDFNINLLNYQLDNHTAKFLDNVCSSGFFPYINILT